MGAKPPFDLERLREDPVEFARVFLGMELVPWQVEFLSWQADSSISAGRGSGKTAAVMAYLTQRAVTRPNTTLLYLSGKAQLASQAMGIIKKFVGGTPLERSIVSWSDARVAFDNGSVLWALAQSEESIRGWHAQFRRSGEAASELVLVIDEAEIIVERIAWAAWGITTGPNTTTIVLGSGGGEVGWWPDNWHAAQADPAQLAMMVSTEDLVDFDFVDAKQLKKIKRRLTDGQYRSDICGEFTSSAGTFIPKPAIERAMTDDTLPLPYNPSSTYVLGWDHSSSMSDKSDRSAGVLIERQVKRPVPKKGLGSNRDRINRMLVDTGQCDPCDVGLDSDDVIERPVYRIAKVFHFQYLSGSGLEEVIAQTLREYPGLTVFAEKYESELWDFIARRIKRPDDPLDKHRRGRPAKGKLDVTVNIIPPTPDRQQEAFSIVRRVIMENELQIPQHGANAHALIHELMSFGVGVTLVRKLLKFGTQKAHDDLVYALGWALYGVRREKGQGRDGMVGVQYKNDTMRGRR